METLPSLQAVYAAGDTKYSLAAQNLRFCYSATNSQSNNTDSPGWSLSVCFNTSDSNVSVCKAHDQSHT